MNIKVYVGCGLTHAPEIYRQEIALFKSELRKQKWITVLDFITNNSISEKPDPHLIYCNDIHDCVGTADAFIADLTHPSTGLGWELGTAIEKHILPTFMCAHENAKVSYLPVGAPLHKNNKHVTFHRYKETVLELLPFFLEELNKIKNNR